MKKLCFVVLLGAFVAAASCTQAPQAAPAPAREEAPLLLDDAPAAAAVVGADNSRCQVCHANLSQEELAVTHARANIGCAGCHGECDAHIADESWGSGGNGTAPERMFVRTAIGELCLGCHAKDKLSADNHSDLADGAKVCTDCHGKHRLHLRRCVWK
jgi:hypothetical protein